jgi:hypothetical protein
MTEVLCKNCGEVCDIKSSKSEKNLGKEYYACPSQCKNVWNGWVEGSVSHVGASSKSEPVKVSTEVKCTCGAYCVERTSFTPKNKGKKFWACPSGCKVWNGWVSDLPVPKKPSTVPAVQKPSAENNSVTSSATIKRPAEKEVTSGSEFKVPKISYHCDKCDKILDIEHELDNNISRYSGALNYPKEMLKLHLRSELQEAITNEEYTCEKCLGNE